MKSKNIVVMKFLTNTGLSFPRLTYISIKITQKRLFGGNYNLAMIKAFQKFYLRLFNKRKSNLNIDFENT